MKTILKGPEGLTIELDTAEIYPDNPGMGTPALVVKRIKGKQFTASYECAADTGELDCGDAFLTPIEGEWLEAQRSKVYRFLSTPQKGPPQKMS